MMSFGCVTTRCDARKVDVVFSTWFNEIFWLSGFHSKKLSANEVKQFLALVIRSGFLSIKSDC